MSKFNSGEGSKGSVTRSAKNWLKQPKYPLPFPPEYEAKCGYSKEGNFGFLHKHFNKNLKCIKGFLMVGLHRKAHPNSNKKKKKKLPLLIKI